MRPSGANRANVTVPRLNVSGSKVGAVAPAVDRPARNSAAPAAAARPAIAARRSQRLRRGRGASITTLARQARQRLDVEREVAGRLEALLGVLLEAVPDDPVEGGRQRLAGRSAAGAGSSFRIAFIVSTAESPLNARRPVSIS